MTHTLLFLAYRLIVLLVLFAIFVGVLMLRPGRGDTQDEGADEEAPIVAPSRVAESEGEPRVVLDSSEVRRIGLTTAAGAPISTSF